MAQGNGIDLGRLTAPFPKEAIQTRQGGGGKALSYVATHSVIHRLNDATGNRWDFRLTRFELIGDTYVAIGELTIPGLGTRTGIGVQKVAERSGEDLIKGAASDCLKKCATLFGVGLELYGPDYEADDGEPPAPNLAAVHAAATGKVEGEPHQRLHELARAAFGAPSMTSLTQAQAVKIRKAVAECRNAADGEALIALAVRIDAATDHEALDAVVKEVRALPMDSERRALLTAAGLRVRQAVKEVELAQAALVGTNGTTGAGDDRYTR